MVRVLAIVVSTGALVAGSVNACAQQNALHSLANTIATWPELSGGYGSEIASESKDVQDNVSAAQLSSPFTYTILHLY